MMMSLFSSLLAGVALLLCCRLATAVTTKQSGDLSSIFDQITPFLTPNVLETFHDNRRRLEAKDYRLTPRFLQDVGQPSRACGEVISQMTAAEVLQVADVFINTLIPPGEIPEALLDAAKAAIFGIVEFDFEVVKVCLACSDVTQDMIGSDTMFLDSAEFGFASYCGSDAYAYDAPHSALVFLPIDPSTGKVFQGKLKGFVSAHSIRPDLNLSISESFPSNVTDFVAGFESGTVDSDFFFFTFQTFISAAAAANAGMVSVMPDNLGYGESYQYNRTFLTQLPYEQATAPSWLATEQYIQESSGGCSLLDRMATASGYSEGGYAIIPGAFALSKIGVNILSVHAGGAPLDLITQLSYVLDLFANTADASMEDFMHRLIIALMAFGYSQELPFLANTGSGELLVADDWNDPTNVDTDLIQWLEAPNPLTSAEIYAMTPVDPTEMLNANLRAMFELARMDNVTNPCIDYATTGTTDKLCEVLSDNGLMSLLEQAPFKVVLCHSRDDEVVTPKVLPDFPFAANGNVEMYVPPLDALAPRGTHSAAQLICAIDPIIALRDNDSARSIEALDNPPASCAATSTPNKSSSQNSTTRTEDFEGLELLLRGITGALDEAAFAVLTKMHIDAFFVNRTDLGVSSNVESNVTVTNVITTRCRERRNLQTDEARVVFDLTLEYTEESGATVVPEDLAAAPFATEESRAAFVEVLMGSGQENFASLQSVSDLTIPETVASSSPTASPPSASTPAAAQSGAYMRVLSLAPALLSFCLALP